MGCMLVGPYGCLQGRLRSGAGIGYGPVAGGPVCWRGCSGNAKG